MKLLRSFVVFTALTACVQSTSDDAYSGPLRPSVDGPTIAIKVAKDTLYEDRFNLELAFTQKKMDTFTYAVQVIGPTQLSEDNYLARNRVVHPKENPTIVAYNDVVIFCGTYYEVRVEAYNSLGFAAESFVFSSRSCTNQSAASCLLSNLVLGTKAEDQRHLQFSVTGIKPGNGCTWKVETKHGSQPIDSEFALVQSGDVYADQIVDLAEPGLFRGITWFRVTAYDHTPLRRSIPLQNAFTLP